MLRLTFLATMFWQMTVSAQVEYDYTTNNGTITITGYTGSGGAVAIPSTINGLPVTSIGDVAFQSNKSVTSVTIPNSVTTIGDSAFESCTSLTSVTIPNSVTNIGAFTFQECIALTSVTIPNSVTKIGYLAFSRCTSLTAITVDAQNQFYSSVDGVLFDKLQITLVSYPSGLAGSYTIPNSVTNIGYYAFFFCTTLTSVTLPDSVITIGVEAFCHCTTLTNVTLPNSVITIGNYAFYGCASLTSVTIPNSVTSIGDGAFFLCTALTSVTIPKSVTSIGHEAFSGCTSLTSVYFVGNAPNIFPSVPPFANDRNATVYYQAGSTGWGSTFGGVPTAVWNPSITTTDASFGVRTNQFGFTVAWASRQVVVVEASTNLANPVWQPLQTNIFTGGLSPFSDPHWTNFSSRFYRLRLLP